jgi:hypothetical protein
MQNFITNVLSGNTVETVTIPITLTIPKTLYDTYKEVTKQWNLPMEETLAQLANQGIQKSLREIQSGQVLQGNTGQNQGDLGKELGFDLSKLTQSLNKIQDLAKTLQDLERKTNELGLADDPTNPS